MAPTGNQTRANSCTKPCTHTTCTGCNYDSDLREENTAYSDGSSHVIDKFQAEIEKEQRINKTIPKTLQKAGVNLGRLPESFIKRRSR